jgi:hypothetical protein
MNVSSLPDFERVRTMWKHYWAHELYKRPLVISETRDKVKLNGRHIGYNGYQCALTHNYKKALDQIDLILETTRHLGESVPNFSPDHGADQFAAFCGTELQYNPDSGSSWAHPVVEDWSTFLPLKIHTENPIYQSYMEYSRQLVSHSKGRYAVSVADLHSNIDAIAAIRGPQRLCTDFYECPELIDEAMRQVRALYAPIYNALYEAGNQKATGTTGWAPFWCEERFAMIQADFICMMSPEMFRRYVLPALEEEASFLDHCVYHLDGPGALIHLDDILSIKKIDTIQWVPGAGQPPQFEWMDVLKKCQKAGKGLQLFDNYNIEIVKKYHRELDPVGCLYCLSNCGEKETQEIIDWLERNT